MWGFGKRCRYHGLTGGRGDYVGKMEGVTIGRYAICCMVILL